MIKGKGFYIWNLADVEVVMPQFLANLAKEYKFSHFLLKVADGASSFNAGGAKDVVDACHAIGVQVWGWQYVYGRYPVHEAVMAKKRIDELGLDGFVIDAESEYKLAGPQAAKMYMDELVKGLHVPVGLSSYRWPSYHPEFPWDEFMNYVDVTMPQVYWLAAHNPTAQLTKCVQEYRQRWPDVPIIPTGAAFQEAGWRASEEEIIAFGKAVKDLGLTGYNFWEWANAIRYELWDAVANLDVELPDVDPVIPTNARVVTSLVNFRSDPNARVNTNRLGQLLKGTSGEILEHKIIGREHWVKISVEGWIAAEYYGAKLAELK